MTVYCFDTSALLQPYVHVYPPSVFARIWENIDAAIDAGVILAPDAVMDEIEKKDDDLLAWAKDRKGMFLPLETDIQAGTTEILTAFPKLIEAGKMRTEADPFVVATARVHGHTVVTEEIRQPNRKNTQIPEVCDFYKVPVTNFLGFMQAQGWSF